MSSRQERVFENWDSLKGKILERWHELSNDELIDVEGHFDELVSLIEEKTGEARKKIKRTIDELSEQYGGAFAHVKQAARDYAGQTNEAVHEAADRVREQARERYERANEVVRRRPAETVAVAFGTGLLVGLVIGLISRSK
jgi:uncharacterized protein YjbJ (UPF0337 family)